MNAHPTSGTAAPILEQDALHPDCSSCFALCCTAFGFTRSADFAIDKPPAAPCPNLATDFSCTIHDRLLPRGFRGCTVFDCFGAGQAVSQRLFKGISWREAPESKPAMFASFKTMKQLHEMLWHLAEAEGRTFSPDSADEVHRLRSILQAAADGSLEDLLVLDIESLQYRTGGVLREVSEEVRAGYLGGESKAAMRLRPGADLAGANLRGRQLCGADLRGACLIAADLRAADLTGVDLLGADLRDARLDGADLTGALFLTQAQVTSARGTRTTRLPRALSCPDHWNQEKGA
jgi:hypothetical protein